MVFALADRLNCHVHEIEALPDETFREWLIYLTKIKPEVEKAHR